MRPGGRVDEIGEPNAPFDQIDSDDPRHLALRTEPPLDVMTQHGVERTGHTVEEHHRLRIRPRQRQTRSVALHGPGRDVDHERTRGRVGDTSRGRTQHPRQLDGHVLAEELRAGTEDLEHVDVALRKDPLLGVGIHVGVGKTRSSPRARYQLPADADPRRQLVEREPAPRAPQRDRRREQRELIPWSADQIVDRRAQANEILEHREPLRRVGRGRVVDTRRFELRRPRSRFLQRGSRQCERRFMTAHATSRQSFRTCSTGTQHSRISDEMNGEVVLARRRIAALVP